jgi:AGZA family xanthine/uracil permease-like MFS transporter
VTALSYGISTPPMFIYLFGVLKPALDITGDPDLAITIGMAACFLGGFVEAFGALIGPWLRKHLPRASMLGALAGVAFPVIAGQMFFHTFESPVIGMFVMVIVCIGLIAQKRMPWRIPASLFAIVIGTVLAFALKFADFSQITHGLGHFGFYPPLPTLGLIGGLKLLFGPFIGMLAALVPISVYNFIETMNNVEAMASAGDDYNLAEAQVADGIGTMVGTLFGGVFPTTVYLASISSKWLKAGRGYSIVNGMVFFVASTFGIIAAVSAIVPLQVVAPILVFVGISMVAQTFVSIPQRHYPAAVLAMLPYFANYISTKFASTAPGALLAVSPAIEPLGQGAMFTAIVLGAILVFIIDGDYIKGSVAALAGAGLTAVGFIHAPKLAFMYNPDYVLAYVVVAITLIGFHFMKDTEIA